MTQLKQILNDVSFEHAENYYYKYHHNDSNQRAIGLLVFFDYVNENLSKISSDIDILSKLATLFVDEPDFIDIYNTICSFISEELSKKNKQNESIIPDEFLEEMYYE